MQRSGSDSWTEKEADVYFPLIARAAHDAGLLITHETHRSRYLYSPWVTERAVDRYPDLHLTADVSHWTVVSERLLTAPQEQAALAKIAKRVKHIHARIGSAQVRVALLVVVC